MHLAWRDRCIALLNEQADMRAAQTYQKLQQTQDELADVREAEASARASFRAVQAHFEKQHAQLEQAERQTAIAGESLSRGEPGPFAHSAQARHAWRATLGATLGAWAMRQRSRRA